MARVKRGTTSRSRHNKLRKLNKGYQFGRSKLVRQAKEAALHAGNYAFAGRRQRRRDMRKLWIMQTNIALENEGLTYSKFMGVLKTKNILLNRKMLAELAINNMKAFKAVVSEATQ